MEKWSITVQEGSGRAGEMERSNIRGTRRGTALRRCWKAVVDVGILVMVDDCTTAEDGGILGMRR